MAGENQSVTSCRHKKTNDETVLIMMTIAIVGFTVMSIESGALMSGVHLLPLVAAMQLIAGVRLGPLRGSIAAGIGTFFPAMVAYGSFDFVRILTSPIVAGAPVNALLSSSMFKLLEIDIQDGEEINNKEKTFFMSNLFLAAIFFAAVSPVFLWIDGWAYRASTLLLLIVGLSLYLSKLIKPGQRSSMLMVLIITSIMSSIITSSRAVLASGWDAVFVIAVPWFIWDMIYSMCGLQLLSFEDSDD